MYVCIMCGCPHSVYVYDVYSCVLPVELLTHIVWGYWRSTVLPYTLLGIV